MFEVIPGGAIDVEITLSKMYGTVQEWSITIDGQRISGSDYDSQWEALRAMVNAAPGEVCAIDGVGSIRVPHPQAAMAADVMLMDCSQSVYLVDSVRLVPDSPDAAAFLDPFYTVGPVDSSASD